MKFSKEDRDRSQNLKGLVSNARTRPIVFLTGGLLLGAIGLGYMGLSRTASDGVTAGATVGTTPSVTHVPGSSASAEHDILQQEANRAALEAAQQGGQTSIPVLTSSNPNLNSPIELPTMPQAQQAPPASSVPVLTVTPPAPAATPPSWNTPSGTSSGSSSANTPIAPAAPVVSEQMNQQILGYLSLWAPSAKGYQEFNYVGQKAPAPAANTQAVNDQAINGQGRSAAAPEDSKIRFVRAGTMLPAYLITPLNSDSPGPVIAQITSGPLAGARLIGTMQLNKDALLVKFAQISKPGWPDIYSINAVGMDDRFSTSLATDVNHHYFKRYAGMLGGAFLTAYGQAMSQQGKVTVIDPSGGVITQQDALSTEEIQRSASGGVLSALGGNMKESSNVENTVIAQGEKGSPLPIQILFLGNF